MLLAVIASLQRSFIYFPDAAHPGPAPAGAEDVTLTTADGLRLGAWWWPGDPAVVVLNGNAGDRSHRAELARALAQAGYGVLLFDYRGYGGNAGSPSETGLAADARAAAAFAASRASRVAYVGESLGAAVAVSLAAERPPAALVLRSPFTSLAEMARLHYPWLPLGPLLADRYDSLATIARVHAPLLVVAGDRDDIVPLEVSRRLYEAANEPKTWVVVDGAGHNEPALATGPRLVAAIVAHLGRR